jgi:hypothetical protein
MMPPEFWKQGFGQSIHWRGRTLSYRMRRGQLSGEYAGSAPLMLLVAGKEWTLPPSKPRPNPPVPQQSVRRLSPGGAIGQNAGLSEVERNGRMKEDCLWSVRVTPAIRSVATPG